MSKIQLRILEKRLIDDFKKDFKEKIGYTPEVISKNTTLNGEIQIMSLEELLRHFDVFLPTFINTPYQLTKRGRNRAVVELRFIFYHLAHRMGYSSTAVGKFFNYDHTTILYGLRQFDNLIHQDEDFQHKFKAVVAQIQKKEEIELV